MPLIHKEEIFWWSTRIRVKPISIRPAQTDLKDWKRTDLDGTLSFQTLILWEWIERNSDELAWVDLVCGLLIQDVFDRCQFILFFVIFLSLSWHIVLAYKWTGGNVETTDESCFCNPKRRRSHLSFQGVVTYNCQIVCFLNKHYVNWMNLIVAFYRYSSEKGLKNSCLNRDSNPDLCDADAMPCQLKYQ